jgi:hypothetical protein
MTEKCDHLVCFVLSTGTLVLPHRAAVLTVPPLSAENREKAQ